MESLCILLVIQLEHGRRTLVVRLNIYCIWQPICEDRWQTNDADTPQVYWTVKYELAVYVHSKDKTVGVKPTRGRHHTTMFELLRYGSRVIHTIEYLNRQHSGKNEMPCGK